MTTQSFGTLKSSTSLMVSGLRAYLSGLTKRGMDEEFIAALEADAVALTSLDAEQEALKAQLKVKSAELRHKACLVRARLAEAKKVVKLSLPQTTWVGFGIPDKR
jgi:hypothetical protein